MPFTLKLGHSGLSHLRQPLHKQDSPAVSANMTSDGQSAAPAPAPKRKASDMEPGSERVAKCGRFSWGATIKIKVPAWREDGTFFTEDLNVHEDILFAHSPHLKAKLDRQPPNWYSTVSVVSHRYEQEHFKCYIDWIYFGDFDDATVVSGGEWRSFLHVGDGTSVVKHGSLVIMKLCSLLILNERDLKDDTFKSAVLTKLRVRLTSVDEKWTFCGLEEVEVFWTAAKSTVWVREWVDKWHCPELTRGDIDKRSATMDAGLLAILHKKVPPMLRILFGTTVIAWSIVPTRSRLCNRSTKIASMSVKTNGDFESHVFLQGHDEALVKMWQATFDLDDSVHFNMPSLSDHVPGIDQRKQFCQLFAMAEYLGDSKLQKSILVFFINFGAITRPAGQSILNQGHFKAMSDLGKSSGLRRWFIDYFAASATPYNWSSYHCSAELKTDVMNTLFGNYAKPVVPTLADLDKYCKAG